MYETGKIESFKVPNIKKERDDKYEVLKKDKKIKAMFTGMLDEHLYDKFYQSIAEPNSDGVWVDWEAFKSWLKRLPTEKKWIAA